MAPEVINDDRFNTKADVFAFGILMLEVLTGQRAYKSILHGKKRLTIFPFQQKVYEGLLPEIEKGSIKRSHQIMIEKCLSEDPKDHDFLDFECLQERNVINYEDDNDEDSDDEIGIDTTFGLNSVDYEEVLDYISIISEEPKRCGHLDSLRNSSDVDKEYIEQMKKTTKELEQTTKMQASAIFELHFIQLYHRINHQLQFSLKNIV